MDNIELSDEERDFVEGIDWGRRLWPRAMDTGGIPGEWELTVRGTEEEFDAVHRLLVKHGYSVIETGADYEFYEKENDVEMIDVWIVQADTDEGMDLVFDNRDDLMTYLRADIDDLCLDEGFTFSVFMEQMTRADYDALTEVDL